jgi:hypothetical protein
MYLWPQKFNMYIIGGVVLTAVLRIRIHRIHVFLGLLDLDLDPLVRGMDPDRNYELTSIATSLLRNYVYRYIVITKLRLSRHRNIELLCTFRDIVIMRNYA